MCDIETFDNELIQSSIHMQQTVLYH